jgi:hypothetical protein
MLRHSPEHDRRRRHRSWLKARLGPDGLVAFASLTAAFGLILLGLARDPIVALCASFVTGASWTLVVASLYAAAQIALPDWVRARGLAIFLTVFFGAITVGSAVWGRIAGMEGLPVAHFLAAACAVVAIPLTWRWKLATSFENEVPSAVRWNEVRVTRKIANIGKADGAPLIAALAQGSTTSTAAIRRSGLECTEVALARELAGTPTIVTLCADIPRKSAHTNESILPRPGLHLGHELRSLVNMSLRGKRGDSRAPKIRTRLFILAARE